MESGLRSSPVRLPLFGLALSMLLSSLGVSIANVALPAIGSAFSAPFASVQWIVIVYLVAVTVTIVSVGRAGDIVGHRRMLLSGIGVFTFSSLLCGLAPTLPLLLLARLLQGFGAAILMALAVALVRETVGTERIGRAMGLVGTMSAVGTMLGPSLGGVLLSGPGWRAIFLVMVPLGILNLAICHRSLPADQHKLDATRPAFDGLGTVLLGLALSAYALALTSGDRGSGHVDYRLLGLAAVGMAAFLVVETRVKSPLIKLRVLRDARLSGALVMNGLVATVMMGTLVVAPFYLSRGLGLGATLIGLLMSVGPVISVVAGVPAGRLVDRFTSQSITVIGLVIMTLGAFAFAILPVQFGIPGYVGANLILAPGYQLFQAANTAAVMGRADSARKGVVSGMLSLMRNLGLITGSSAMGAVFAYASGPSSIMTADAASVTYGLSVTFVVAGVLILCALTIALVDWLIKA